MVRELERPPAEPITVTSPCPATPRRPSGSPSVPSAPSCACWTGAPR